jgi:hypothetical protein
MKNLKEESGMEQKKRVQKLIPTLLATVYTIPAVAMAGGQINKDQPIAEKKQKSEIASEAVKQEVIQLIRKEETDLVSLNIAGQPGIYYRISYSATGKEKSYAPLPKGEGTIGDSGFGSVSFELKKLGKDKVYLKVTTSDTSDFSKVRITPKPIIINVKEVKVMEKGWTDKLETRTPPAVAGVRG